MALVGFWIVLLQLVKIPARVLPNFSGYPLLTIALVFVMSSLVPSLVEEAGFRGYFQVALERELIWETGANTAFWINVAQAIIFSTLAVLALRRLAKVTKHVYAVEVNPKLPA